MTAPEFDFGSLSHSDLQILLEGWRKQATELDRRIQAAEARLGLPFGGSVVVRSAIRPLKASRGENFKKVFDYLKAHGKTGVTDIGRAVGLGKTSVSSVVRSRKDVFQGEGGEWELKPGADVLL